MARQLPRASIPLHFRLTDIYCWVAGNTSTHPKKLFLVPATIYRRNKMTIPSDYLERTYAGVLGKIIGVYLGRPIEGWSYERITEHFGEVGYYINDKVGAPLVVTDDDISGTFTFLRALPDYGNT